MKIFALLSLIIISLSTSYAGTPKRVSKSIPAIPDYPNDLNSTKLRLIKAEKTSQTLEQYTTKEAYIIAEFKILRSNKLRRLQAKEVIQCYVRANKPSAFKGRNTDSCVINNDTSYFKGWNVISANDKRHDTVNGGQPRGGSSHNGNRVTLKLTCKSPKWKDTSSGKCQLKKSTTIIYRMSEKTIKDATNKEVGELYIR